MSHLPDHWCRCEIGDLGSVRSGGTPKTAVPEYWNDDVAWITPADLSGYSAMYIQRGRKSISREGLEASSAQLMPAGSVLFSSRAPVGYVAVAAGVLSTNQGFKSLVPANGVRPEFLYYYLQSIRGLANERATGTTFKELSGKAFAKLPVRLAPTVEQQTIAAKVEALFSELDAGVAQLEAAQALLTRYRQSVLKAAFEGRLTAEWREQRRREAEAGGEELPTAEDLLEQIEAERQERAEQQHAEWRRAAQAWEAAGGKDSGEKKPRRPTRPEDPPPLTEEELESLPELPEGWAWTRADMLVAADRPICYGILMPKGNVEDGVLYVKVRDMRGDRINVDALQRTAPEIAKQYDRASLVEGDVLLAIRGTYGRVALVPPALEGGNITQDSARLTITPLVNRDFCAWALRAPECQNFFKRVARGVAVKGVNIGDVRLCPMPLCSDEEQAEIVREVESRLSVIDDIENTTLTALTEGKALRQSILKRAFEGRLLDEAELEAVRSHPDYEPADRLLERIREQTSAHSKTKKKTTRKKRSARKNTGTPQETT
ncbi:MAG: restriction endonuclease subunit S [Planctomycetota bacterium]